MKRGSSSATIDPGGVGLTVPTDPKNIPILALSNPIWLGPAPDEVAIDKDSRVSIPS